MCVCVCALVCSSEYKLWVSLSLFCTRGSHKQYSQLYIGAFNISVIVFRSVFTNAQWVYLFGNLYTRAHIHICIIADFKRLTQTRNRTNTAQMSIIIGIQYTAAAAETTTKITITALDSATYITSHSMCVLVVVVFFIFIRCSLSFLFIRSFIVPIAICLI